MLVRILLIVSLVSCGDDRLGPSPAPVASTHPIGHSGASGSDGCAGHGGARVPSVVGGGGCASLASTCDTYEYFYGHGGQ
jgi:hypothetical protein